MWLVEANELEWLIECPDHFRFSGSVDRVPAPGDGIVKWKLPILIHRH
jgi:hypothetical protein